MNLVFSRHHKWPPPLLFWKYYWSEIRCFIENPTEKKPVKREIKCSTKMENLASFRYQKETCGEIIAIYNCSWCLTRRWNRVLELFAFIQWKTIKNCILEISFSFCCIIIRRSASPLFQYINNKVFKMNS